MLNFSIVTWCCIHFVNAYRQEENEVYDSIDKFRNSGVVFEIDFNDIKNDMDLFEAMSDTFSFPDYFGFNWGAFDECLRDLDWLEVGGGVVLVAKNYKKVCACDPDLLGRFISSWLFCAEEWSKDGIPFHLVLFP